MSQVPAFPVVITNPPGLPAIRYRVGDFAAFREALLLNLPGEVALQGWRPTADGDLTLQLLEWWAYIADILTFYNERIANFSYLGTAILPGATPSATTATASGAGLPDTTALIAEVTGYQSQPGLAASGQVALLVNSKTPIALPAGFAVQSKPGPGQQSQIFEAVPTTNQYLPTDAGGAVPVDLSCQTFFTTGGVSLASNANAAPGHRGPLLKGTVTSLKPGDVVAVALIDNPTSSANRAATTVASLAPEIDPRGRTNTRLNFNGFTPPATSTDVTLYEVMRSIQSALPYAFYGATAVNVIAPSSDASAPMGLHLASLVRDIGVGDLVVLESDNSGTVNHVAASVKSYQETVWYANAPDQQAPYVPPTPPGTIPITIPHSFLTFDVDITSLAGTMVRLWYGFHPVSTVLDDIASTPLPAAADLTHYIIQPAGRLPVGIPPGAPVLIEGADGLGAIATLAAPLADATAIQLTSAAPLPALALPLRLLFNVVDVTAGKTVTNEVLGNGDATLAGQSFTLQKSPLTYLKGADPSSPISTLQLLVDNVAWTEVASFFNQAGDARVFITRRDKSQVTTVITGDGVNGARLPTGTGNITARYRYGSGPGDPAKGGPAPATLVTIVTPVPGLGSVRNPVAMTGGAAASTPTQIQATAPQSALALGLAVSPGDYAALAAQAPLVTRSRAASMWNPTWQRNAVTVYVDGGTDAVTAVSASLAPATDPNNPVSVVLAQPVVLQISIIVAYASGGDAAAVQAGVTAALADPVAGLFSPSRAPIGQALYDSQVYAACLRVPGVVAARGLVLTDMTDPTSPNLLTGRVHQPGPGGYFALAASAPTVVPEVGHG